MGRFRPPGIGSAAGPIDAWHWRFLIVAAVLAGPAALAEDIEAFRVTSFDSIFTARYRLDEWSRAVAAGEDGVRVPVWEEELQFHSGGYVYHPALLDWSFVGGPVLTQSRIDSASRSSRRDDTFFNVDTELEFLQRREFPFGVFYRRDHGSEGGLSADFLTTVDEYGVRGMLRSPLTPFSLSWEAARWQANGSGVDTVLDEMLDRASLNVSMPWGRSNNVRLRVDRNERDSSSGSLGLPIRATSIDTTNSELNSDMMLGGASQGVLRQTITWRQQETGPVAPTDLDALSYSGSFDWRHTGETRSFANLRATDVDRGTDWSRQGDIRVGVVHEPTGRLILSGETSFGLEEAPGFSRRAPGVRSSANYRRPLPFGSLGASASVGMERVDQDSRVGQNTVFDESIALAGTAPIPLSREFVVPGSIVVMNETRTQTFSEGIDYRLSTVGAVTRIERLIGGSITDGQTVLVTYDVTTGGTVTFDAVSGAASLNLSLFRYYSVFVQYSDVRNRIGSGLPTTPLNDSRSLEVGGRIDLPIGGRLSVGGEYRFRRREDDIAPYTGYRADTYVQVALAYASRIRLGTVIEQADIDNSAQDVDLTRFTLGLTSRLWQRLLLRYTAEYLEDEGAQLGREEWRQSLDIEWSYRAVQIRLRATDSDITQGDVQQNRRTVRAELRRLF